MEKKRRNMLLYVTATSMVGLACNDSRRVVGDVAQGPDYPVGKIAMVTHDAAPETTADAAAVTAQPAVADAGGIVKPVDAGTKPPRADNPTPSDPKQQHWVGKVATPDK